MEFESIDLNAPYRPVPPRRKSTGLLALTTIIVLGTVAVMAALWTQYYQVKATVNPQLNLAVAGFKTPVLNKLDPKFTDNNGDLVAETPTDAAQQIDPATLYFCYVAVDDPEKYKIAWKPFTDYLSKMTGKPVEYLMASTTTEQLEAMRDGKLQVAGFNTGNVPTAVNKCGFIPVCGVPTSDGTAKTHTEIIVPADSSLKSPTDLKGHELTLTEPGSNSGYKAPLVLLRSQFGVQPMSDVMLRYSGSHEASIEGIASGKYEAAAVAADMLSRAVSTGGIKPDQYRSIFNSESFPTAGMGYVYNLKPELAKKIRDALLSFDWKGTPLEDQFTGASQTKFVPVNYKDDWSLIRRIDDEMGVVQKVD